MIKKIKAIVRLDAALMIAESTRKRARRCARKARSREDYDAVREYNNIAYSGDCLVAEIREMKASLK